MLQHKLLFSWMLTSLGGYTGTRHRLRPLGCKRSSTADFELQACKARREVGEILSRHVKPSEGLPSTAPRHGAAVCICQADQIWQILRDSDRGGDVRASQLASCRL